MKRFYNLVVSFITLVLFLTGIKAEAQYTYIKGSMADKTTVLSTTYLQTLDNELTAFATANGYTIYLNLNTEILSPKVVRNLTPQSIQVTMNERRSNLVKNFKKYSDIDLKLNNGVVINLDFLLKNKIDSGSVLESYFMQTLVPGQALNTFSRTGLSNIPQTSRLRIGTSYQATNQQAVQVTIDRIKALFIDAKAHPKDNFLFGPLRVNLKLPTNFTNAGDGYKKYVCTEDTFNLSLLSAGFEDMQARITGASITFSYNETTGAFKNVVISKSAGTPVFTGHQGFLNINLTALNLTIEPETGINGTATLNTLTDRDIELQNLLVLKQGFGGDFQFTYSNSTDFSGTYNFSGLSNFEVDFIKDRQPVATVTGTINSTGTINATLATTAPVTVQAANFTLLVNSLNLNFDFSVKLGVKINSGSLSAVFSNIPGFSGNVPVSASYDQYGNIIANLQTSGLSLSVCGMQIVNPALNLVLDNNLDITTLEGSAAMKHSLFDTQIAISQFRWTNDRGIEIFNAQGGVVYKGFNFQFSRFEYNNGQFDISAKVILNTGGSTNFLDVTNFTVSDDGSIDIGAISGQIRATLVDFAFQAEFTDDRFKGGFTGKIANLINAEGAVDIGQYKQTNGTSYTFCYIKIVVGSSTGIPLGSLPIKLTQFGGEYGYNYFIDYQNRSNPPTGPKLSNYILGLTLGIADVTGSVTLTGNPVAQIGANSASFTMNGNLKAPSTNPWFNVPIQAGFTLPSGEIYGGFTFDFKVPKTTGSIIDARGLGFNFLYTPTSWYVGRKGVSVTLLSALTLTMDSEFSGTYVNPSSYRAYLAAQLALDWHWSASKTLTVLGYSAVSASASVDLNMNAAAELEIQASGVNGLFAANMDANGSITLNVCPSCNYSWTTIPVAVNAHLAGRLQFQNTNITLHADGLFQVTIASQQGSFQFDVDYNFNAANGNGTATASANTESRTVPVSAGTFTVPTSMPTAGAGQRSTASYNQAQAAAVSNPVTANANASYVASLAAYSNIRAQLTASGSQLAAIEGSSTLESKLKSSGTYVLQNLNDESVTNGNMLIQYGQYIKANPGAERNFATNRGAFDTWFAQAKANILLLAAPTTMSSYPTLKANLTSSNSVLQSVEGATTLQSKLQASGGYVMSKLNGESAGILVDYAKFLKANSGIENTFKNDNYAFDAWLKNQKIINANPQLTTILNALVDKDLKNTLISDAQSSTVIMGALSQNPILVKSWEFLVHAVGNQGTATKHSIDIDNIRAVDAIISNTQNMQLYDAQQGLAFFISKYKVVGCAGCGVAGQPSYMPTLSEVLKNTTYCLKEFNGVSGFQALLTRELYGNLNAMDGIQHMFNYLKGKSYTKSMISSFDLNFNSGTCPNCQYDILLTLNGSGSSYIEFKSYQSTSSISLQQFNGYISNISNLNNLKYVFNAKKMSQGEAKQKMLNFMTTNADAIFQVNRSLFGGSPTSSSNPLEAALNAQKLTYPIISSVEAF